MTDNNVVYKAKLHWILFFWPAFLACAGFVLAFQINQLKEVALLIIVFALLWILMTWINYHFASLTIHQKQIILRTGMLVRQTIDIPLNKVESIDIRQSIIGSIFHYGSLAITGTGGSKNYINFLNKPLTCRRYIEQLMHEQ